MTVEKAWLLTIVAMVALAGGVRAGDSLSVVVSIPPQQWLVERIAAERVEVEVLLAPGESPATYLPTDAQVTRLMRSDVYFRIGVPFERGLWFDAISKLGRFQMVDLRQGIALQGDDPHIWLSPALLATQARTVAQTLAQIDPNNVAFYSANVARLESELQELDNEIRRELRSFSGRAFFVYHPSWGYFAAEYDLVSIAIEIEGREPSDSELTELLAKVRATDTTTIFVSPQIHDRGARAIAEAVGARVEILDPLASEVATNLLTTTERLIRSFTRGAADD